MNRFVPIAFVVTALATAWLGRACEAGNSGDDEVEAAAMFESGAEPDQLFRVEWAISVGRSGRSRISGYVFNQSAQPASNVQLRVSEVGTAGEKISTVVGPVLASVPGQGRVPFDIQIPGSGTSYQVGVSSFSFDFSAKP
jgi:uncharacterized protein (DUF1501 family)